MSARPAIATVVSSGGWESRLAFVARASGLARVLRRCATPVDVERVLDQVDAIVVGAETAWLSVATVQRWKAAGAMVVGMAGEQDQVAVRILRAMGCDVIAGHGQDPMQVLTGILSQTPAGRRPMPPRGLLVRVTGPRGAPGRTEVALAIAWSQRRRTLLAELDTDAPSLGLRLGLDPEWAGREAPLQHLQVFTPPLGSGGPLTESLANRLMEVARTEFPLVVADVGPPGNRSLDQGLEGGVRVVVCEASPVGIVRAARVMVDWEGPPPSIVLNRVRPGEANGRIREIRAATGLEPIACIPHLAPLPLHRPHRRMVEELAGLALLLSEQGTPQRIAL